MGILAKLNERSRDRRGGQLDVNLMNAALALQQSSITSYLSDGELPTRIGSAAPYSAPNEAFETADGWVMVAAYNGNRWDRLCEAIGLPHLVDDARFATSPLRVAHREAMRKELTEVFRTKEATHWVAVLREADILCARVANYSDVASHPQVASNAMIASMEHPTLGTIRTPGFPIDSAQANALPHTPAPCRGEHSRQILAQCGYRDEEIEHLLDSGAAMCTASR